MSNAYEGLVPTQDPPNGLYKTLDLLRLDTTVGPLWFVIEGSAAPEDEAGEVREHKAYYYDEHSCPTNYLPVVLLSLDGDTDPHGVFDFVDFVWMTSDYVEAEQHGQDRDWLVRKWPQIAAASLHEKTGEANG